MNNILVPYIFTGLAKPTIRSLGLASPRFNSGIYYSQNLLTSVGPNLLLINLNSFSISLKQQIGISKINQVIQNNSFIITINFQGLITLFDKQLKILKQIKSQGKECRNSYIDDEHLILCHQISMVDFSKTCFQVYRFVKNDNFIQLVTRIHQNYSIPCKYKEQVYLLDKSQSQIFKYNLLTNQYQIVLPLEKILKQILFAKQLQQVIFFFHVGGAILLFNVDSNQIKYISISSTIMAADVFDNQIYCCQGKYYYIFDKLGNIQKLSAQSNSPAIFLKILQAQNPTSIKAIIFSEQGLEYCNPQKRSISLFHITNCGLAMDPKTNLFAVGDFLGFIYIYSVQFKNQLSPLKQTFVQNAIRCLAWSSFQNKVYIGTMSGLLLSWDIQQSLPTIILKLQYTITSIKVLKQSNDCQYLYLSTINGKIHIYAFKENEIVTLKQFNLQQSYQYQNKQTTDTLHEKEEIWSISVLDYKHTILIVCGSQDQSISILEQDKQSNQIKLIKKIYQHTMAVTSVDVKFLKQGIILASCSDDKKVCIFNQKFQKMFQINTFHIKEWHTLTYLELEQEGTRVAFSSLNGYIFVFDIKKRHFVYGEKLHSGGVQGLIMKKGKVISCGTDLVINIIQNL